MADLRCAICDTRIDDSNRTEEHVIPQAIGGRLTVRNFICATCNNRTGKEWDKEVVDQLSYVSTRLGIKRPKGSPPPVEVTLTTGRSLKIHPDGQFTKSGKPQIVAPENISAGTFSVNADTIERAEKIALNLKKKYEKMGAKVELEATNNPEQIVDQIQQELSLGGKNANRSTVKTAIAFAVSNDVPAANCDFALPFLHGQDVDCIGLWYARDFVTDRSEFDVFHCVSICGDPQTKILVAYIEHYGAMRYLVCLSKNYQGPRIDTTHALDPQTGLTIQRNVKLSLTRDELQDLEFRKYNQQENMFSALRMTPCRYRATLRQSSRPQSHRASISPSAL